jgi:hypothetical protein
LYTSINANPAHPAINFFANAVNDAIVLMHCVAGVEMNFQTISGIHIMNDIQPMIAVRGNLLGSSVDILISNKILQGATT